MSAGRVIAAIAVGYVVYQATRPRVPKPLQRPPDLPRPDAGVATPPQRQVLDLSGTQAVPFVPAPRHEVKKLVKAATPMQSGEAPMILDVEELEAPNPTTGKMYQVKPGDTPLDLAQEYVYGTALRAAAQVGGLAEAAAKDYAQKDASNPHIVRNAWELVICNGDNDQMYGTYRLGSDNPIGPHGRGIPLGRVHPDNRARFAAAQPGARGIAMGDPGDYQGDPKPHAVAPELEQRQPYLYFPAVNLAAYWQAKVLTTQGMTWGDGSSTSRLPPPLRELGIVEADGPGLPYYGCEGVGG